MRLEVAQDIVRARSHGLCEGCGRYETAGHCHHRRARGTGGTYREAAEHKNDPRNLLYLCPSPCHDKTEQADTWRECEGMGWRVEQGARDPFLIPVLIYTVNGYGWWLLDEHGGYHLVDWPLDKRITWRQDDGTDRPGAGRDH